MCVCVRVCVYVCIPEFDNTNLNLYYSEGGIGPFYVTGGNVDETNYTMKITLSSAYIFEGIITEDKSFSGTLLNAASSQILTTTFSYTGGN